MSTANRVIKNTGYLYAKMAITMFISLYTTRLILGGLGEKDFGVFNIVGGAIAMLCFLNGPMAQSTQRFLNYYEGNGDKEILKRVFSMSILLHGIIGIVVCLFLELGYHFMFDYILNIPKESIEAAKWIYQFMVVSTLFTILSVPYEASLNAHENMFYFSIVGVIESLLKLFTALYVVYTSHDKLIIYGLLMAGISLIKIIIMRIYCIHKYDECSINLKKYYDKPLMKDMFSFASWSFIGSIANLGSSQGSAIVMNNFFGVTVNAAQGIANQLAGQIMTFSNNMIKALNPVIVKQEGANDRAKMVETSLTGNKISFLIMAFFAIPFIIEMPYILKLWLKNPPELTIVFCRLLIVRLLFSQISVTFGTAIGAVGKIREMTIIYIIGTFSVLPLCYIAFRMGYSAVAFYVIYLFISFILLFINTKLMNIICGMSISKFIYEIVVKCVGITVVTILFNAILLPFIEDMSVQLILSCVVSCSIIMIGGYIFVLNKHEKLIIDNLLIMMMKRIRSIKK